MARELVWLHLSDLHMNPSQTGWDASPLLHKLLEDLKTLRDQGLTPHLLFFTGDAGFGHLGDDREMALYHQLEQAHDFLTKVREVYQPAIPQECTFLVPGNHDVHRDMINPADTDWINHPGRTLKEIQQVFIGEAAPQRRQRKSIFERLETYRHFLATLGYGHLVSPRHPESLIYATSRLLPDDRFRVGIAGLNTAWTSVGTGIDEKNKLLMAGEWQIGTLRQDLEEPPCDLRISLLHHKPSWLRLVDDGDESKLVDDALRQHFAVALHGHEHDQRIHYDAQQRHLRIEGGACYEGSKHTNAYNLVRLDLDAHVAEVWLRRYDKRSGSWGPDVISNVAPAGVQRLQNLQGLWTGPVVATQTTAQPAPPTAEPPATPRDFTARYREAVVRKFDRLQLFGLPIANDESRGYPLSVAYVTLALAARTKGGAGDASAESAIAGTAEAVFDRLGEKTNRLLIRGDAGSGKTTLLLWAAVQASRAIGRIAESGDRISGLEPRRLLNDLLLEADETLAQTQLRGLTDLQTRRPEREAKLLAAAAAAGLPAELLPVLRERVGLTWRRQVPFLLRLRHYKDGKLPYPNDLIRLLFHSDLPDPPPGWAESILENGYGLVLLDGVDEVAAEARATLRAELQRFIKRFPDNFYIVTMRPTAAAEGWLDDLEFAEAEVTPLQPQERDLLVDRWHEAVEEQLRRVNKPESLQDLAAELKGQFVQRPALAELAKSPLLCAAICALHRERPRNIPDREAELFEALVRCLVDRRDHERPGLEDGSHVRPEYARLSYEDRKALLSRLALEMLQAETSELDAAQADRFVADELSALGVDGSVSATDVRQALVERSGLLREPVTGEIDFAHNALKEYLAAERLVNAVDVDTPLAHTAHEAWQRVCVYAVGLPRPGSTYGLQFVKSLLRATPQAQRARGTGARSKKAQAALAAERVRQVLLLQCRQALGRRCPAELRKQIEEWTAELFPPRTRADALALGKCGDAVVPHLEYLQARPVKEQALCALALRQIGTPAARGALERYPKDCALTVAQELVHVVNPLALRVVQERLLADGNLPDWTPRHRVRDVAPLAGLAQLHWLNLSQTAVSDVAPLAKLAQLQRLDLSRTAVRDVAPLAGLRQLQVLDLSRTAVSDVVPLAGLVQLQDLYLSQTAVSDVAPLAGLVQLQGLDLSRTAVRDVVPLAGLVQLKDLYLSQTAVSDVAPLAGLVQLQGLDLSRTAVSDVAPLAGLPQLQVLDLRRTAVSDVAPLAGLRKLRRLYVHGARVSDLSPLRKLKELEIFR